MNGIHIGKEENQSNKLKAKNEAQSASSERDGSQSTDSGQPVHPESTEAQSTFSCVCLNISSDDVDSCNQAELRFVNRWEQKCPEMHVFVCFIRIASEYS